MSADHYDAGMEAEDPTGAAEARLAKSDFMNVDGRVRCPTSDCWGDLVLMPTGRADDEGIPQFQSYTACPLCMASFEIEQDVDDRDLYLRISWLRANPESAEGISPEHPPEGGA